jgi:hypothetical protein
MVGEVGVMAPATRAGLTVTVLPGEHWEADAKSVTLYEYVAVEAGEALYDDDVADGIAAVHVPSEYHWYE